MGKRLGYKDIVRNIIESHLHDYIRKKRNDHYPYVESIDLELDDEDYIGFNALVEIDLFKYNVHGIINSFGTVSVTSVSYDIMRCTRKDEYGNWDHTSAVPVQVLIYKKEDLKDFNFDWTKYDSRKREASA